VTFQIYNVVIEGREHELSRGLNTQDNVVSVLTGKNGTGKSTILEFIASNFVVSDSFLIEYPSNWDENFNSVMSDYSANQIVYRSSENKIAAQRISKLVACVFKSNEYIKERKKVFPTRLICLSTSPFDRFPINVKKILMEDSIYSYIGMKNSQRNSSIVSLISNVLDTMFKKPEKLQINFNVIRTTLDYLGYGSRILVTYRSNLSRTDVPFISKKEMSELLSKYDGPLINSIEIGSRTWGEIVEQVQKSISVLVESNGNRWKNSFSIPINLTKNRTLEDDYIKAIQVLSQVGLFKIKSLKLSQKQDNRKFIDFINASSGEQCLALMLLGIASQIENNSLICIDEPEISLHPEWQKDFIPLINNLFGAYRGCHFIIATHSPLIISNLESKNCFVLDLDNNDLVDIGVSTSNSSDYQLATLFKSPGFRNEYLVNESLDILNSLAKLMPISETLLKRTELLVSLKVKLDESDPVYSLINTIEKVLEAVDAN